MQPWHNAWLTVHLITCVHAYTCITSTRAVPISKWKEYCELYKPELIWSFASLHEKGLVFSCSSMHWKAQYVSFTNIDLTVIFSSFVNQLLKLMRIWICRCCHTYFSMMFRHLTFTCHFFAWYVWIIVFCLYFLFIWLRRVWLSCSVGKQKWAKWKMNVH